MTPPCNPGGMAVDFVRSCFTSKWALWGNRPDLLTRGFYYIVPDDTPFVPGWHYFGTADWTWERDGTYIQPVLGEIKEANRPYEKGNLPIGYPPPFFNGSVDCLASGEVFPPVTNPVTCLVAGIDCNTWTQIGEIPPLFPDASSLGFWFQPSALPVVPVGTKVPTWPDSSPFAVSLSQVPVPPQPTYIATGLNNLPSLFFDNTTPGIKSLLFGPAYYPCKSYMLYVVARAKGLPFPITGPWVLPVAGGVNGVLSAAGNRIRYNYDGTDTDGPTANFANLGGIFHVRRKTGYVEVGLDGTVAASSLTPGPQTDGFNGIAAALYPGIGQRQVEVSEMLCVNGQYSDALHLLYLQYLAKKYQIPLTGP